MTPNQNGITKILVSCFFAALIGFVLAVYKNNHQTFNVFASVPNAEKGRTTPSLPKPLVASQISPDGTKKVIMKTTTLSNANNMFTFSIADSSGFNEHALFNRTLDNTKTMTIPFNAWSPDNRYFFVEEEINGAVSAVFVLKASGELFENGEKYLNAVDIFSKKQEDYHFFQATGWASETLLIVNTTTATNKKGPSFWFEVPSTAVLQLSTEF